MKNTSSRLPQSSRNGVVNQYTVKLVSSGYSLDQVHRIVVAGLRGFEKKVKKQLAGKGLIHQSAAGGAAKRNRKKLLDKTNWFRGKKQDQEEGSDDEYMEQHHHHKGTRKEQRSDTTTTNMSSNKKVQIRTSTVLFVEQTPRGELARRFREAEKGLSRLTGFRVKVVERCGTKVVNILHKSNPWAESRCQRTDCYPCKTGDDSDCFKRNILYFSTCAMCKQEGKEQVYVGESSRSSYERGGEHERDFQRRNEDSHILKHLEIVHPGVVEPQFQFRVAQTFQSALARQVSEAVMIRRKGEAVINSKGVYNRCYLPRLTIEQNQGNETTSRQHDNPDIHTPDETETWQTLHTSKRGRKPTVVTTTNKRRRKEEEGVVAKEWGEEEPTRDPNMTRFLMSTEGGRISSRKYKQTKIKQHPGNLKQENEDIPENKVNPCQKENAKRKMLYSYQDFERDCKRRRPEFSPEVELELELKENGVSKNQQVKGGESKIIFFSLFSKTNANLNHNKMFKQTKPKPKLSSALRKRKSKVNSAQACKSEPGMDIRKYLDKGSNQKGWEIDQVNSTQTRLTDQQEAIQIKVKVQTKKPLKGAAASVKLSTSLAPVLSRDQAYNSEID